MSSFTESMFAKHAAAVERATTHPFLRAAGERTLKHDKLAEYLTQDRAYAFEGYPRFIGHLLAHLPLSNPTPGQTASHLALLAYALTNIARETQFFDALADRSGLSLTHPPSSGSASSGGSGRRSLNSVTKAYVDYMLATGASGRTDEGMVVLWAMEALYLKAWTFARSQQAISSADNDIDPRTNSALDELVENWTGKEFQGFVRDCEQAVDVLALEEGGEAWGRCEEAFLYVLWLEERFWPSME